MEKANDQDLVHVLEDTVDVLKVGQSGHQDLVHVLEDTVDVLKVGQSGHQDLVHVLEDNADVLKVGQSGDQDLVHVLEDTVDVLKEEQSGDQDLVHVLEDTVDVLKVGQSGDQDLVHVLEDTVDVLKVGQSGHQDLVHVLEDNVDVLKVGQSGHQDLVHVLEDNFDVLKVGQSGHQDLVHVLEDNVDVLKVGRDICLVGDQDEAFYILDLGDVVKKHEEWRRQMPRVHPYYAVKCHPNFAMIRVLAALGTGFDCASKAEIDYVMSIGVPASRIIFANPAKSASHIRHAAALGVHLTTFDNDIELRKTLTLDPAAKLVLRFRYDAADAKWMLGFKFGCDALLEGPRLIRQVRELDGDLVGVSFHVGSLFNNPEVFRRALVLARGLFDEAERMGFKMTLLDIGGGFPGHSGSSIAESAILINSALSELFPDPELQVIAEPGTFFAASAFTLYTQIHAKREMHNEAGRHVMYFVNDGTHGSFGIFPMSSSPLPAFTPVQPVFGAITSSSIFGPTCSSKDVIYQHILLPEMEAGDWLEVRDMGAYTRELASTFNGFPVSRVHVVVGKSVWLSLRDKFHGRLANHFQPRQQQEDFNGNGTYNSILGHDHEANELIPDL